MAKKSIVSRESKRKFEVRVRNRCAKCGPPAGRLCAALASAASVFAKKRYGAICRALSSPVGSRTDYSHAVVFWGGGSCAARMKRMYWL